MKRFSEQKSTKLISQQNSDLDVLGLAKKTGINTVSSRNKKTSIGKRKYSEEPRPITKRILDIVE
jgi:hypothetical protein